jgi:peptidoglycan-N-acetylglucosamine deacetylase
MLTFRLIYIILFWILPFPITTLESESVDSAELLNEPIPRIAVSFDDGSTTNMPGYSWKEWHFKILNHLENHQIKGILFAVGGQLNHEKGKFMLESWNEAGHYLGNHTYSHPNFSNESVSLEDYKLDYSKNKRFLESYANFLPYFRFPYLREGETEAKRDGFRQFLDDEGVQIAHVTVDGEDWYINNRLVNMLKQNPKADLEGFRNLYVQHHVERARFNDSLAMVLTGRKIDHVLLLHHNLAAGLFLGDLLDALKVEGWELIDIDVALQDSIYLNRPQTIPAGGNLLRALSKEKGIYGKLFRFPAENEGYLKKKMDKLGL